MGYYAIGAANPVDALVSSIKQKIRDEAGEGAKKAVAPIARKEAAEGARKAVTPMVIGVGCISVLSLIVALKK